MLEAEGDGDSAATMFGVLDLRLDDALRRRSRCSSGPCTSEPRRQPPASALRKASLLHHMDNIEAAQNLVSHMRQT
jgi:hypothetical protein